MTVTEIYNAEVKVVSEQNDYLIEARVRIDNGKVMTISNGIIKKDENNLASFENWGENSLNFNVWDSMNTVAIISEILTFIEDVKNNEELINNILNVD